MENKRLLVISTCPDMECAQEIASAVVGASLVACVNILPGATSVYRWQDQIEQAQELVLLMKTTAEAYPALETAIQDLHPYELPEIIAVPIEAGLAGYLDWIDLTTVAPSP